MKKLKAIFIILYVFLLVAGCQNSAVSEGYKNISALEFNQMIGKGDALILDVRTPAEYSQAHIRDSVLIPVQVLHTDYTKIADQKDKNILVYCRSGNRSVTASNNLINNGFKKIYNLKGGIKEWVKEGLPVQTSE